MIKRVNDRMKSDKKKEYCCWLFLIRVYDLKEVYLFRDLGWIYLFIDVKLRRIFVIIVIFNYFVE